MFLYNLITCCEYNPGTQEVDQRHLLYSGVMLI